MSQQNSDLNTSIQHRPLYHSILNLPTPRLTQLNIPPSSLSSLLNALPLCSTSPSLTVTLQAPQLPTSQLLSISSPASRIHCNSVLSPGTSMTLIFPPSVSPSPLALTTSAVNGSPVLSARCQVSMSSYTSPRVSAQPKRSFHKTQRKLTLKSLKMHLILTHFQPLNHLSNPINQSPRSTNIYCTPPCPLRKNLHNIHPIYLIPIIQYQASFTSHLLNSLLKGNIFS